MTSISLFLPLLRLFAITAAAATLPSDVSALKAFKASIDPTTISPDSCLASWDFSYDPCTSTFTHFTCGVYCSGNRVTQLNFLEGAGYAGTLSPLVSQLTQLITIDLSHNKLSGPIPTSIFSLPNLVGLNLQNNSFSGTLPPVILALKTLKTLDLSQNLLSGQLPDTSSSPTLFSLDLSFNKFTGPLPKLSRSMYKLALNNNNISGGIPETMLSELTDTVSVDFSVNFLSGRVPGWFFQKPVLAVFNLSHNGFTAMEVFKPLKSKSNQTYDSYLGFVDLGYNKIVGYLSANFTAMPSLFSLSLQHNKLKGPIPKEFSRMDYTGFNLDLEGNYLNGKPSKDLFSQKSSVVSGSFGDNCLKRCPKSSKLCSKSQKLSSICRKAYGGK